MAERSSRARASAYYTRRRRDPLLPKILFRLACTLRSRRLDRAIAAHLLGQLRELYAELEARFVELVADTIEQRLVARQQLALEAPIGASPERIELRAAQPL